MKTSICFIVVTYNNANTIKTCIESIENQNYNFLNPPQEKSCNLIVIDNNSKDKTLEIIKKYNNFPFYEEGYKGFLKNASLLYEKKSKMVIKIIKNKKNLGFAKAINQGFKYAKKNFNPNFYFILNPDAYLEKDCLKNLELKSEDFVKSPLIINPENNQPWFSGAKINWFKFKTSHIELPSKNYPLKSDYLTGCVLLIPKRVIQTLSPPCKEGHSRFLRVFDEKFFLYYEDADFSLRAKKARFQLQIIPHAICYHKESTSSNSKIKNYHLIKSGLIFFHKHYPKIFLLYFWFVFYLRFFYHKYFSKKETVLKAIIDFKKEK